MNKTMSITTLTNRYNKAARKCRNWSNGYHGRTSMIMLDTRDAKIWADCFINCDSWEEYHSGAIEPLSHVTKDGIKEAVRRLRKAGWIIAE